MLRSASDVACLLLGGDLFCQRTKLPTHCINFAADCRRHLSVVPYQGYCCGSPDAE